jgi:hypothetical protein
MTAAILEVGLGVQAFSPAPKDFKANIHEHGSQALRTLVKGGETKCVFNPDSAVELKSLPAFGANRERLRH